MAIDKDSNSVAQHHHHLIEMENYMSTNLSIIPTSRLSMFDKAPYKMMIDDSEISSTNYSNLNHRAGTDAVTAALKRKNDRKGFSV